MSSSMVNEAVDTADLSLSTETKPVVPDDFQTEEVEGSFLKSMLVPLLMPHIRHSSFTNVPWFQAVCGEKQGEPESTEPPLVTEAWHDPEVGILFRSINFVLSVLFHMGAFIGSEAFYITMFPYVFWNIDTGLGSSQAFSSLLHGRRIITMWGLSMYLGQYLKDHLQLPRPYVLNKAVRSLESQWVAEYGFPSTHTIAVVGQACIVVYHTHRMDYEGKGDYPLLFALAVATFVVVCTTAGRVYLGVHSIPDLIGGFVIAGVLFSVFLGLENTFERFLLTNPASRWAPTVMCIIFLLAYPRLKHWSPAYGDTAVILGACNGVWVTQMDFVVPGLPLDWRSMPALTWFILSTTRLVVGFLTLALVRLVVKTTMRTLLLRLLGKTDKKPEHRYEIDVPTKFVCYSCVGLAAVILVPKIFELIGLHA
ncbi:hypothetical protein PTSG_03097 [Salpingoeca rosetta]|uniref:Phosphatidic acid phosphatase type 2/haloperoxidase domain-containing protein n=1 Tax=Salpingoeca rosetta (strain ATCC 50818 / BSB-021) TaxID=946362 RepID=F2U484_SALR5|nr:uncharacterized protein PTSG_03097 [Salpingoeca rosetta]EGD82450.1 hypothetical protein PTSG_03097 [Salpingoeca rosetta]|eukprot:XP_004995686.1 hypothetical protein PTSG_03097 [Salpingoeca rosetta]